MSKFKVGDEFIEDETVGRITSITKANKKEVYGYCEPIFYNWEYVRGFCPPVRLRRFAKYSKKYHKALPLTRLSKLLYDI